MSYLCQDFLQSSKYFWNADLGIANSSYLSFYFISSILAKYFQFIGVLSLWKRKRSAGAKCGENGGWVLIMVLCFGPKLTPKRFFLKAFSKKFFGRPVHEELRVYGPITNCRSYMTTNDYTATVAKGFSKFPPKYEISQPNEHKFLWSLFSDLHACVFFVFTWISPYKHMAAMFLFLCDVSLCWWIDEITASLFV